jgi:hypothetical protein
MNTKPYLAHLSNTREGIREHPATKKLQRLVTAALFATTLIAAGASAFGAQKLWSGVAGDMLWSTAGNWSPSGMPGVGDSVIFTNDATTDFPLALGGSPDNFVDSLFLSPSITSLGYMNTNAYHNTQLTNLLVVGTSASGAAAVADDGLPYAFFVGSNQWQDGKDATVWASIVGTSLTVSNVNANFAVTQISSGGGGHRSTLDMTNLSSFTCVVSNVMVGQNFTQPDHAWRPTGELFLAQTNTIKTKLICVSDAYQNAGGNCYIHLGAVNQINADAIEIGMHKCVGFIDTASAFGNPSVTFRNAAGTGRALTWELGDEFDANGSTYLFGFFTSNQARGTMDLTGASVDGLVDHIVLGRGQRQFDATNRTGDGNGTLIFGGGTIDANSIEMGIQVTGPFIGGSVGHGVLTIDNDIGVGPALMIVRSNIVMAVQQAGAAAPDATGSTGDINVNDGSTLAVAGDIVSGGPGGGTATINLFNAGTLDMMPTGDSTPGNVSINILNLTDGIITNYGILSVTNINELNPGNLTFTVYPGQSIAPAGVNTIGPLTMGSSSVPIATSLTLRGTTLLDIGKNGATAVNDVIDAPVGTVDVGGTLKVSFSGTGSLAIGDKFTLFTAVPVNSSPTVILPPPGSGLAWNNKIFVDGSIEVVSCGCGEPTTPPTLTVAESPSSVTVSWPVAYTSFALRAKTNNLSANWGSIPGVVGNSFTIPRGANSAMFFQLIQQ